MSRCTIISASEDQLVHHFMIWYIKQEQLAYHTLGMNFAHAHL